MNCRIADLRNKQVVCIKTGQVLGYVYDVEINTANGSLTAIVIPGKLRVFGFFGHEEDIIIPWQEIEVIGQETILVTTECNTFMKQNKKRFF